MKLSGFEETHNLKSPTSAFVQMSDQLVMGSVHKYDNRNGIYHGGGG